MTGNRPGRCTAALGVVLLGASWAEAQFRSEKVALFSRVPIAQFGSQHENANDVWGYVSPSGREYAIIGLSAAAGFVEITDPVNPVIVGQISHPDSLWADIETYDHYAYVVNETGDGLQVIDLADIDQGIVRFVRNVTQGGLRTSHTLSINPASGFAYPNGSNLNRGGLVFVSLADPANPQVLGGWSGNYVHDSQVVTYTDGPYAGREIAFCCLGGGLGIVDVTHKNQPVELSRYKYPDTAYTHQGWLTADRRYFFIDDELDELRGQPFTRTIIVDVSDLANPFMAAEYTNGVRATDHNLYVHEGFVYGANYKSGLRVLDAADPLRPVEVGFFDTWPNDDASPSLGFNGAWSPFPFFPSGTALIADMDYGLFILDPREARSGVTFDYPEGRLRTVRPDGSTRMRVEVFPKHGTPLPSTGRLHVELGGAWIDVPMEEIESNVYDAVFPAHVCGQEIRYYLSVATQQGYEVTDPFRTSLATFAAVVADSASTVFADDFESDQGWTVAHDDAWTEGDWARGVPPADSRHDPDSDADGSGQCFLTGGSAPDLDVDGGATFLTSPRLDLSARDAFVEVQRWFFNDDDDGDRLGADISNDDGTTWVPVDRTGRTHGWVPHTFRVVDFVVPTAAVRVRFSASDTVPGSTTEAAVDAFRVFDAVCDFPCEQVENFKARCSLRGKLKATARTSLPAGTVIHFILDGAATRPVTVNDRGRARAVWSRQSGGHEVRLFECDGLAATAECP